MVEREEVNRRVIEELRARGGGVGGQLAGTPLLLLTVTGARTSRPRTVPLAYLADGDRLLVVASNLGAPELPDWYYNLLVHPDVSVEVGGEAFGATAIPTQGDEGDELFARFVERFPYVADHQAQADRVIPVVALVRQTA